jgi:hypothetical protein
MRTFRSWRDITSSDPAEYFGISLNRNHHVAAISEFVRERVLSGWSPSFLTFQFRQINGPRPATPLVDEEGKRDLVPETHYLRSNIPDHEDRFNA